MLYFQDTPLTRVLIYSDTLRRHMRRDHKVNEPPPRTKYACTNCRHTKSRCEGGSPCSECLRRRIPCSLNSPDGETENASPSSLRSQGPNNIPYGPDKVQHYLKLYFSLFHPHWPFMHRASFNMHNETPLLVQSMVVMGLWVSKERSAQSAAIDLHKTLNSAIRQQTVSFVSSHFDRFTKTEIRRKNGMLQSPRMQAAPVPGPFQHTRPFYYTSFSH